ncbi:unnamed protein product [Rotaria socialis]|uniref:EGF-like domain-containing protein n=1 Tax=Rotaria socialis TaxID=392032 RepID=A0A817LJY0_9BILA|nr:unnamed protein product [Rotaria socialis]
MMIITSAIVILLILPIFHGKIYLFSTEDSSFADFYDCLNLRNVFYCRRPIEPIALKRDQSPWECHNNGTRYSFTDLKNMNISISTILHKWLSSIEKVDEYARYLRTGSIENNAYLCACYKQESFGKHCEYFLPYGSTFEKTVDWKLLTETKYPWQVQIHGQIICYSTLLCNHSLLCLDWRDICDGTQQCMLGYDEENCDILEFNECEVDEYRCTNGMCIPGDYFVDGDYDCMDWSDEKPIFDDKNCVGTEVSVNCDDRMCPPNLWSCGDGQCITDRLAFQSAAQDKAECLSRRDQFYLCETNYGIQLWTMPNGRCSLGTDAFDDPTFNNGSLECIYLIKCSFSGGAEKKCPCKNMGCSKLLEEKCPSGLIQYPLGAIISPFVFHFYNFTHTRNEKIWDSIVLNGTIKCRNYFVTREITLSYSSKLHSRIFENIFCNHTSDILAFTSDYDKFCYNKSQTFNNHSYNFIDVCSTSRECISAYRIRDGTYDCMDRQDEEILNLNTCSKNQHHRFRCSNEEPTCLTVTALGDQHSHCKNQYDELWMGSSRLLSKMNCNIQQKEHCRDIRQYIEQSWSSNRDSMLLLSSPRIQFRAYCDTFWNFGSKLDENATLCQRWWICPKDQWRCRTGQCINITWLLDGEWDCPDASDEQAVFLNISSHNFQVMNCTDIEKKFKTKYSMQPFSTICNTTVEFPCFRNDVLYPLSNITYIRPCIPLENIGNGHPDCLGGIDERNRLEQSNGITVLGYNFKCLSTGSYVSHSSTCDYRCSNILDDEIRCYGMQRSEKCKGVRDFMCLNETCVNGGHCNSAYECEFGEDEYMCDLENFSRQALARAYREKKELSLRNVGLKLQLSDFPIEINRTRFQPEATNASSFIDSSSSNSTIAYICNRGIGVYLYNGSIACFCPPQYYGDRCEFHSDRLNVFFDLNVSRSIYADNNDQDMVLKLLVVFLFKNQTLDIRPFHFRLATEMVTNSKRITHFVYSRSAEFINRRRLQYLDRSQIIKEHPYSLQIEAYEFKMNNETPVLVAVWQYPIYFDYLPNFRFTKEIRLEKPDTNDRNPCSRYPCNHNQICQQIVNNRARYVCLCKSNYTGTDCLELNQRCAEGYCSPASFCRPMYRSLATGNDAPFCLCPSDYYGQRCELSHDICTSTLCKNGGTCYTGSRPDRHVCVCTEKYRGIYCELPKPEVTMFINGTVPHVGAVIQFFIINFVSLNLILVHQRAYHSMPNFTEYRHDSTTVPEIVLLKLYANENSEPDTYLISLHIGFMVVNGTTYIGEHNRLVHVNTLLTPNERK